MARCAPAQREVPEAAGLRVGSLPPSLQLALSRFPYTTLASSACSVPPELTARASRKANTTPQNRDKKITDSASGPFL